jgi:hypothetical protein
VLPRALKAQPRAGESESVLALRESSLPAWPAQQALRMELSPQLVAPPPAPWMRLPQEPPEQLALPLVQQESRGLPV